MTRDSTKVDLVVLSTCFGGNLVPSAGCSVRAYVIASPDNLHLSYFDIEPLERLDVGLRREMCPVRECLRSQCVRQADWGYTDAVSVVVYDVDRVREFLHSWTVSMITT